MDQSRQANTRPWYEVEGGGLVPGRGKGRGRLLGFFLVGWGFDKKERPQEGKKKSVGSRVVLREDAVHLLDRNIFCDKVLFLTKSHGIAERAYVSMKKQPWTSRLQF